MPQTENIQVKIMRDGEGRVYCHKCKEPTEQEDMVFTLDVDGLRSGRPNSYYICAPCAIEIGEAEAKEQAKSETAVNAVISIAKLRKYEADIRLLNFMLQTKRDYDPDP